MNQTVRLPRWRRAASYSAQFLTRCRCLGMRSRRAALNGMTGSLVRSRTGFYATQLRLPTCLSMQKAGVFAQRQPVRIDSSRAFQCRARRTGGPFTRAPGPVPKVLCSGLVRIWMPDNERPRPSQGRVCVRSSPSGGYSESTISRGHSSYVVKSMI